MTTPDTAPIQAAYPVIEAERDMAIAQRDSAWRKVARLRAALERLVEIDDMHPADAADNYDCVIKQAREALASASGEAVRDD